MCSKPIQIIYGICDNEERHGSQIFCLIYKKEQDIGNERHQYYRGMKGAAEKMIDQIIDKFLLLTNWWQRTFEFSKIQPQRGKIVDIRNSVSQSGTTKETIRNSFLKHDLKILAKNYNGILSQSLITLRYEIICPTKIFRNVLVSL